MKTWHATLASAEREAFFVREQEDSQNSKPSTQCAALPNPSLVGADPNLSHRADRILSQGWEPTLRVSAVDKFSC
ncbi:hypothetical protein RA210_U580006 [Rubrivivax sp. A210]|nr:hypothetical protein RA210_U580006 [Rubrivivax sp. A210]